MFVVLLWFGFVAFELYYRRRSSKRAHAAEHPTDKPKPEPDQSDEASAMECPKKPNHKKLFEDLLVDFHKAQCYFSATIQIASLNYGIFDTDMLVTFMLTPLATNGVLPVVFTFVLLFRCGRSTMDVTILTVACWFLASLVYWVLYANIIPINTQITSENKRYRAYQQFMYKLSALDACGGYSALAVCPQNFVVGKGDITSASHKLRVLTPLIWTFATFCLLMMLAGKVLKWRRGKQHTLLSGGHQESQTSLHEHGHPPFFRSRLGATLTYWVVTLCFLAGIGMQLSLLSIGTSLNMMNRDDWSFGQIIAVTLWEQPLLGWLYVECKYWLKKKFNVGKQ